MSDRAPEQTGIVPDTRDWTWVLERSCPQCGLAAGDLSLDGDAPTFPGWDQDRTAVVHHLDDIGCDVAVFTSTGGAR